MKKSLIAVSIVVVMMFVLSAGGVFAEHDSTAELQPEWSPAGESVDYTVTFYNDGGSPDAIGEVRIYNNPSYTGFTCDQKTGWILTYPAPGICNYYAYPQATYKIIPGSSEDFTFSATTPDSGCEWTWQFETRDITFPDSGSINYLSDTTSVDDTEPMIIKTLGEPKIEDGETWITQDTEIKIEAYDQGECGISGLYECEYRYDVDGIEVLPWTRVQWQRVQLGQPPHYFYKFTYGEDSEHFLEIRCYDIAGNMAYHSQTEKVDTEPPETTKVVSEPKKIDAKGVEWVDTYTNITLSAVDPDPTDEDCNIGVDKTWYKNILADGEDACWNPNDPQYCSAVDVPSPYDQEIYEGCIDEGQIYCASDCEGTPCWKYDEYENWEKCVENFAHYKCMVDPLWKLYDGTPIQKEEESCHVLSYFSIDELGNIS